MIAEGEQVGFGNAVGKEWGGRGRWMRSYLLYLFICLSFSCFFFYMWKKKWGTRGAGRKVWERECGKVERLLLWRIQRSRFKFLASVLFCLMHRMGYASGMRLELKKNFKRKTNKVKESGKDKKNLWCQGGSGTNVRSKAKVYIIIKETRWTKGSV